MEGKKLFRTSIFGGFNKKDVETYIDALEAELNKAQDGKTGLSDEEKSVIDESIQEIKNLKEEKEKLETYIKKLEDKIAEIEQSRGDVHVSGEGDNKEIQRLYEENRELKEQLQRAGEEENRETIRKVLADVRIQAQEIIDKAEKEAEERRENAKKELRIQLENKVIDFLTVNYHLADFTNGIDSICGQLQAVSRALQDLHREIPDNVEELLEKTENAVSGWDDGSREQERTAKGRYMYLKGTETDAEPDRGKTEADV